MIVAQENTRLWLTTDVTWPWNGQKFKRLPKIAQPNKTFYTMGQLESGVRYGYIPDAAHTDGDLFVYFPKQNVLAVGDAVSGEGWPVVDWTTGTTLQLTGTARTAFDGATGERRTRFGIDLTVQSDSASPLRWSSPDHSPANPQLP